MLLYDVVRLNECRNSGHENIISVKDILVPNDPLFSDTFVVFELLPADLGTLLLSKTELTHAHIKSFLYQLLRAVHFMHQCNVYHRDLKPSNILINEKCELKVCDFGLARAAFANEPDFAFWTNYVATRWYRAPELICAHQRTGAAIDQWSVGCIFAEMIKRGAPLFPGTMQWQQFQLITQVTGRPTVAAVDKLGHPQARDYALSLPNLPTRPLESIFPDSDPKELDLLRRLLAFDPDERISAADALRHPYFSEDPNYKHVRSTRLGMPIPKSEFRFETMNSIDLLRREFLEEICIYHPENRLDLLSPRSTSHYSYEQVDTLIRRMDCNSGATHATLPAERFESFVPTTTPVRSSTTAMPPPPPPVVDDYPGHLPPEPHCRRDFQVHIPRR